MVFRAQTRATPPYVRLHRGSRARNRAFDHVASHACNRHGYEHRQKNTRPLLAAAYPCDSQKEQTESNMRGPITKQADVAHEIAHRVALMMRDEIPDGVIQIKCRCDRYRGDSDADQPIEKGGTLHKQVLIAVIPS